MLSMLRFLALLLITLTTPPAVAQIGGPVLRDNAIQPVLVAESSAPAPGSTVSLAIAMQVEPGWHGYWEATGDAGLPMSVDWAASGGTSVGAPRYPLPTRLSIAGLMNYVFKGDYAVLYDVRIPATARPGDDITINAKARWLACTDEICVPEQGDIATTLTVGDGRIDPATSSRFDQWRARLPRLLDQPAHFARAGDRLRIAVPFPAAADVAEPSFFPITDGAIIHAAPQSVRRNGDMLVVETRAGKGWTGDRIDGVLAINNDTGLRLHAVAGPVPSGGVLLSGRDAGGAAATSWRAFLIALGGAMLGGLILNIMPCVFPILSLKALSLARAGGAAGDARGEAVAYTAGVMLMCLALGGLMLGLRAAGQQVGWAFQLQDPRVVAVLIVLMTAITANLAGLFALGSVGAGERLAGQGGRSGAFWTGVLAAFVATPCAGPFMATAIGAALVLPPAMALAVFAGLGLGLALPFLAIGFSARARSMLPRPGSWMERLRRILAVPMGLTALALMWLLSRQTGMAGWAIGAALIIATLVAVWWLGRRQARMAPVAMASAAIAVALTTAAVAAPLLVPAETAVARHGGDIAFSAAALADARTSGKPVFLYFTADWCLTCKANEAAAINRESVRAAFADSGTIVMVGDWTRNDPAITRFLAEQGRSGVPLYLYYAPGVDSPRVLPQALTPSMLTALGPAR